METVNRITYFECVLSLIRNNDIRNFCELLLEYADDYFFKEPASSSGNYHPKYALGNGGLARHSIATALIMNEILSTDCYNFSSDEKDLLICACIVHDIKKYGNNLSHTVKNHPELAVSFVNDHSKESKLSPEWIDFMCDAIVSHMGQWGKTKPETDAQKLLHIADCLASRKYLVLDFGSSELSSWKIVNKSVITPKDKPGDYVLTFGKHKGEKLKDVEVSYLDFLANKFEHKNHPVVDKAQQLLNEIKKQ